MLPKSSVVVLLTGFLFLPRRVVCFYSRSDQPSFQEVIALPQQRYTTLPIFYAEAAYFDQYHQFIPIFIGTPPQKFGATFPIESPDTVVPSTSITEDVIYARPWGEYGRCRYNESSSSTIVRLHEEGFREGTRESYDGEKVQDTISVGDIAIQNQTFTSATDFVEHWLDSPPEIGLMPNGPVWTNSNQLKEGIERPSIFQVMINNGLLERNLYGIKLARDSETPGELHLGWVDQDYANKLVNIPINELPLDPNPISNFESPWHVSIHSVSVGHAEFEIPNCSAIFSTSIPWISLPEDMWVDIMEKLGTHHERPYDVDCAMRFNGPSLTFTLGPQRTRFTVPPWLYIVKRQLPNVEDDGDPNTDRETVCYPVLFPNQESDSGPGGTEVIELGNAFLMAFYSVFDVDSKTVSLAPLDS